MMATASGGTTPPVKRLISIQGVLAALGLLSGIAAIFLSFGVVAADLHSQETLRDWLFRKALALDQPERSLATLLLAPLYFLAAPISAGYLQWLLAGRLAPWAWCTAYALAVFAAARQLLWTWQVFSLLFAALFVPAALLEAMVVIFCALPFLGLGMWLVMRNRRAGVPDGLNALVALQVVYVVWAFSLLVDVIFAREGVIPWGAWFGLLTATLYLGQIFLGSFCGKDR